MIDVFSLLTLPTTSTAFTALKSSVTETFDGSASPRRKVARLDTDSDIASASRSNHMHLQSPIKLTITGEDLTKISEKDAQSKLLRNLTLLQRSIRIVLTLLEDSGSNDPREALPIAVANRGEDLYDRLRLELEQSVSRLASSLATKEVIVQEMEDKDHLPVVWLSTFVANCEWFEKKISLLVSLLTYLDQVYVIGNPKLVNIRTLAYSLFSERIFGNPQVQLRLRTGVSEWVNYERKFRMAHSRRPEIPKLIVHLTVHNQYHAFEAFYIKITREFYTAEATELSQSMTSNARRFFGHIIVRIEEEEQRSKDLLPVGSWNIVRQAVDECIWGGRLEWLANNIVGLYVENKDLVSLGTMYRLFKRVDGVKFLIKAFRADALKRVQGIVKDEKDDDKMVERLLEFKRLADDIITTAFLDEKASLSSSAITTQPNNEFIYALGDAFTTGFKARRNKPAEMIAKYLDRIMRKGQGASTDMEFEAILDSALALYRYTEDKDVFRTFYHRSLAKRLLLQRSASDDFEVAMLKKLKEQYDPEFGMGEDMFKDLALSRESVKEYHSKLNVSNPGHKLSVMVLQRSAWPFTVQKTSVDLPLNMQDDLMAYANYYKERHSGHTLDWDHALGTATLVGRFKPGNKELSVSLYQAVVLLLFNIETEWRYIDILEQTRIDPEELSRVLQSLACAKKKVLKKIPPGRDIDENDVFKFNIDFDDPRAKVHINSIQAKVSLEESRRTNESIEGDRKYYLDAAIVRIMKARKELTYEQLKTATIDAVKNHFVPTIDAIKKRIDALVEGDYLERSPDDKTKFLYVA
ncbi:Cullin-4B [Termitomyces sp. J132]|nr:Cullin-4B [Termitomyces sp. J132]